ncbi:AraC family transcriptional regulator [Negadavirga shengliensis]|uniref:DUF6597 domain-containing transcriptional factor n=1 Tax=Negadavirga shengliensis TaxID=1389218 RepID=A0ABV9T045_9BACT
MNVEITEYPCIEDLKPYVQTYWYGEFNINGDRLLEQQVIPNGFVELIFHLNSNHCSLLQGNTWLKSPDYTLIGLFTKPYEVRFDKTVPTFGIRFKPEGIYNLFGIPAAEFSADYIDMNCVLDAGFRSFSEKLREKTAVSEMTELAGAYLLTNLHSNNINYYYLNRAAEFIRKTDGMIRMDELINNVYISHRQLEREFKEKIGVSPKQYIRIARLNAVNRLLSSPSRHDLTSVSYDTGFSDQAHLIRDFKQFVGLPPSHFIRKRGDFLVNI